jgi:hypothetical protein
MPYCREAIFGEVFRTRPDPENSGRAAASSRHLSGFSVAATFLRNHKIGCLVVPSEMIVAAHGGRIALTVDYVGTPFGLRHRLRRRWVPAAVRRGPWVRPSRAGCVCAPIADPTYANRFLRVKECGTVSNPNWCRCISAKGIRELASAWFAVSAVFV